MPQASEWNPPHDELYDKLMKKASMKNIQHDLNFLDTTQNKMPVVISNWGDPYDMGRRDSNKPKGLFQYLIEDQLKAYPSETDSYVRNVLKTFREYDHPFMILTKGGMLAAKDFDLYASNDWFGVTLTCGNDADSKQNEPRAAFWSDRIRALKEAHDRGIHT